MSGICGIVRFDNEPINKEDIQKMLDAMENRGNDTENIWIDENVGFGHKMLWTTSESIHENQPLISKDGNIILIADARIDNRDELIKLLGLQVTEKKNYTDSDLILVAYNKWGESSPQYIIGDYAFAIWNRIKKELFCVRDAIGIKPFYYYISKGLLAFSSEIEPFFILNDIKKSFNHESIRNLLLTGTVRHEETLFTNIMRLPAMHSMSLTTGILSFKRYWFPEKIKENRKITLEDATEKFNSLFRESVHACLRSAYPIGCELSGGLDSSSIFGVSTEIIGADNLFTFSYRYGTLSCDEGQYIDAMTNKFKTKNNITIRVDQLDFERKYTLERFYQERKDWQGLSVFLSHFSIMEKAQDKGIRIILSGQGGDQILTGNAGMLALYWERRQFVNLWNVLKAENFSPDLIKRGLLSPLLPNWIRILLGKKRKNTHKQNDIAPIKMFDDIELMRNQISKYQLFEIAMIAGMHNNHWVDNNTYHIGGRYNIEFRHPFFNRRLIEFTLSLPPEMKRKNRLKKNILRQAMCDILPDIILKRTDKAEFSPELELQRKFINTSEIQNNILLDLSIMDKDEIHRAKVQNDWQVTLVENWLKHQIKS